MTSPKTVMKLIDPNTGLMECQICGATHIANLASGGRYRKGSWQCDKGCRWDVTWGEIFGLDLNYSQQRDGEKQKE